MFNIHVDSGQNIKYRGTQVAIVFFKCFPCRNNPKIRIRKLKTPFTHLEAQTLSPPPRPLSSHPSRPLSSPPSRSLSSLHYLLSTNRPLHCSGYGVSNSLLWNDLSENNAASYIVTVMIVGYFCPLTIIMYCYRAIYTLVQVRFGERFFYWHFDIYTIKSIINYIVKLLHYDLCG